MNKLEPPERQILDQERMEILEQLEDWLELPVLILGFVWLILLVVDLTSGLNPILNTGVYLIWIIFIIDFIIRFLLAPKKTIYLRKNWLTALSLILPALRVLKVVRVLRILRLAKAGRSLQLVRVVGSLNRGMRTLRKGMGRHGFGYVATLTILVILVGAAAMLAFERQVLSAEAATTASQQAESRDLQSIRAPVPGEKSGLNSYSEALWWTAMIMTTLGSEYWPKSPEGRVLGFLLSLYAFGISGYVTAALATFFIGRDAENEEAEIAGERSVTNLKAEVTALRVEILKLSEQLRGSCDDPAVR
jgi:voltage-gated potassium channel